MCCYKYSRLASSFNSGNLTVRGENVNMLLNIEVANNASKCPKTELGTTVFADSAKTALSLISLATVYFI